MHPALKIIFLVCIIATFGLTLFDTLLSPKPSSRFAVEPHSLPKNPIEPMVKGVERRVINHHSARLVHAPSIAKLSSGDLIATWWGGSREGGKDVQIFISIFNATDRSWGLPRVIQSAKQTQLETSRYVRKLGNAIITQAPSGKLHLFYVSVSVGGWAASSINRITSTDNGATWSAAQKIITAPFLNLSTLVKGAPIYYDDGTMGIPVYHEFAGKFGELLKISPLGKVVSKTRLSKNRIALQPVIHAVSDSEARVLLRYAGESTPNVLLTDTSDGGISWTPPTPINIPNPNSAVALAHNHLLGEIGVFNDLTTGRQRLSLYRYGAKDTWKEIYVFEDKIAEHKKLPSPETYEALLAKDIDGYLIGPKRKKKTIGNAKDTMCEDNRCEFQYDYPYLIEGENNEYHLVYTWNKSSIKHITFTITSAEPSL